MPPLSFAPLPAHVSRAIPTSNSTDIGLDVVCAWPVSGQYGPGTRVLYYVLIATCVFARKEEWLRNACLAGALLFPAIAALHGIVLAAIHVDGAIDMDVYGAFQLCSIGILTAPLTARMSETYFKDPRRNIIFLWTGLVLAGLLSITVELFRVKPSACSQDDHGHVILSDISRFPYEEAGCDLRCSTEEGPFSPIRVGSTNEIYVIPSPNKLTFGTVTLLAAGCCVPAIVSLIYFWTLILQDTWNKRVRGVTESDPRDEPIDGTNGATVGRMMHINGLVRMVLSTVEAPVFAGAVLAILILGEKNFFSRPVDYGTEPIASIGQWAPLVGAGFAIFGSLYLYLTEEDAKPPRKCECSCHENGNSPTNQTMKPSSSPVVNEPRMAEMAETTSPEIAHLRPTRRETTDVGNRRGINRALMRLATTISIAAHERLNDYEFKQGPALDFPEIPAEEQRSRMLPRIRDQYNPKRDSDGNVTLSRTGSNISMASWRDGDRSSTTSQCISPRSSRHSMRSRSPSPLPSSSRRPDEAGILELPRLPSSTSSEPSTFQPRKRQNTLEVPPHHGSGPIRRSPSVSSVSTSSFTIPGNPASPTIVVSADGDFPVAQRCDTHPAGHSESSETDENDSTVSLRYGRRFTS
ncbi:uncharacterized protein BDV17DRAFT_156239 [Aspergillus undulatus]|uniref:uncharacterized protein n=1 Tax=Aspergillus undulatus TaxID=1810928 RepID=UPI003CCD654E